MITLGVSIKLVEACNQLLLLAPLIPQHAPHTIHLPACSCHLSCWHLRRVWTVHGMSSQLHGLHSPKCVYRLQRDPQAVVWRLRWVQGGRGVSLEWVEGEWHGGTSRRDHCLGERG